VNAFSKSYTPVIKTEEVKATKAPKAKPNVFDTGTPAERMERHAQPLPTERKRAPNRPSTM
jgi:hypothetical protein